MNKSILRPAYGPFSKGILCVIAAMPICLMAVFCLLLAEHSIRLDAFIGFVVSASEQAPRTPDMNAYLMQLLSAGPGFALMWILLAINAALGFIVLRKISKYQPGAATEKQANS
ncbi:hypothetical protein L3X17_18260 [Pseudomonas stutzeri]|nr:hypothetical protein [Stutzerimonas stutzeri]